MNTVRRERAPGFPIRTAGNLRHALSEHPEVGNAARFWKSGGDALLWRRRAAGVAAVLFLGTAVADSGAGSDAQPIYQFPKPRTDVIGVPNFVKVSDALYRGGQPSPEGFANLKAMGIRTIVDTAFFVWSRDKLDGYGFRYACLPINPNQPHEYPLLQFLKLMQDQENHPVFVHCLTGADRTGMHVAAYRLHVQKWPKQKVLAEMDAYGFRKGWWTATIRFFHQLDLDGFAEKLKVARPPEVKVIP